MISLMSVNAYLYSVLTFRSIIGVEKHQTSRFGAKVKVSVVLRSVPRRPVNSPGLFEKCIDVVLTVLLFGRKVRRLHRARRLQPLPYIVPVSPLCISILYSSPFDRRVNRDCGLPAHLWNAKSIKTRPLVPRGAP